MTYEMLVEPTPTGYSAYCEAEGALTTGATMEELERNIVEGLNLAVEDTGHTVTLADVRLSFAEPE